MPTFVLIHGAASDSWYWHLVAPLLQAEGHDVVAPDLPVDDDAAGFPEYADAVVAAIGGRRSLIVVGQSMGSFTAALVCARVPADLLVLVAAMAPKPGEHPGDWWRATGWEEAHAAVAHASGRPVHDEVDPAWEFFHDVPADVAAAAMARPPRPQSGAPFARPWPLAAWPAVPTRFLLCRHDRFFPAEFQRRVVHERLRIVPDEMDGGHLPALARPGELAHRLDAYARAVVGSGAGRAHPPRRGAPA